MGVLSVNWSNISFLAGERDKTKSTGYTSPGRIMLPADLDDEAGHWKYCNGSIVLKP